MFCLLRFLGFRQLAATWAGVAIVLIVRTLLSAPPENFEYWPYAAQRAAANSVSGIYQIAYGLWVTVAVLPLVWLVPWKYELVFRLGVAFLSMVVSAGGAWHLIRAAGALHATPSDYYFSVIMSVIWIAVVPLGCGALPWLWIEISERLRTSRLLRRWFYAGLGEYGSWICAYELRKLTKPIPRRL